MRKNYMAVLEYDGTRYDGWQKQGNTKNTIQARIESVLEKWAKEPVEIAGSGRTDAGVHAKGQTMNFHLDGTVCASPKAALDYLNRYLPEDIRVLSVREVPEQFHSRLSARRKTYAYYVETSDKKPVFSRKYAYGLGKRPDVERMRAAAEYLVGEHDFKSFCAGRKVKKSTVRRLDTIEIIEEGTRCIFLYKGNGFLYRMVRILTGTLLEVGLGSRKPEDMKEILAARSREAAGPAVPPEGLFLVRVEYDGE
ncbi:MAG: tRNA pseudouridine(38-40) synthase TruA [Lachnospiraceae bacterium]|nr:tRNA pseudouridine(38-40) synthase TruA [Lachnospiraceae bacterium]